MRDLINHIPVILLAAVAIFFLWGLGYLVINDMAQTREFKQQCIESGMQYVERNCVR